MLSKLMALPYIVLFVANPLITLIILYFSYSNKGNLSEKQARFSLITGCLLCSVFVSLINMVKVPDNDLEAYLYMYKAAGDMPIWQYVLVASDANLAESLKEPLYGVIAWVIYHLSGGNDFFFKFVLSLFSYLFLTFSVLIFYRRTKAVSFWLALTGVFLMTFIPWIFTMSLQLIRQFLAGSILVYLVIRRCFYQKKDYWLMIVMVLIHSSVWFFLPFLLIPAYDKPFKESKNWYIVTLGGLASIRIISLAASSLSFIQSLPLMEYILNRSSSDVKAEGETIPLVAIFMVMTILLYSIHLIKGHYYKNINGIRRFAFIMFALSFFILINLDQDLLPLRFLFYLYPFVPFLLMLFFKEMGINKTFVFVFTMLVVAFFTVFLEIGTWTYDIIGTVWFTPVFLYL